MTEFHEMLEAFERDQPKATREEWVKFAARTYIAARKFGFEEGLKYQDAKDGILTPEQIADLHDPKWRDTPAVDLDDIGARAVDAMIAGDARDEAG